MTRDEWSALTQTVCLRWVELDDADVLDWWDLLDDLEGGHVAAALVTLAAGDDGPPTASALRRATAREEVRASEPTSTGPFLSLAQWRAMGCPSLPAPCTLDTVRQWAPHLEAMQDDAS